MPKASIIIPAYNAALYIEKTIHSILAQTLTDFECIIIDDGSKDNTVEVIKRFNDPRIILIEERNSGGPSRPRNIGLRKASGEYIFMFDSDDIMHSEKLHEAVSLLQENENVDLLFTNFEAIDEIGDVINDSFLSSYETLYSLVGGQTKASVINPDAIFNALIKVNFIGTSSVVLRRSALSDDDFFNEDLKNSDDRLFWVRFSKNHNFLYLDKIHHQYRIQKNSISNQDFKRRAPSKIKALKLVKMLCETSDQKKIVNRQIAVDYVLLSYSYWTSRKIAKALFSFLRSFRYGFCAHHYSVLRRLIAN